MIIATDLDRTLLPNGKQPYDGSMGLFKEIVQDKEIVLTYVTGRNLSLVRKAIKKFDAPLPNYIIAQVGTKIYYRKKTRFREDKNWIDHIRSSTKCWSIEKFRKALAHIPDIKIQEKIHQNDFKLSYYLNDLSKSRLINKEISHIVQSICPDAVLIFSIDERYDIGFLDILPQEATKLAGLEYLRKKMQIPKEEIIYCGDSGNDILPLVAGYKSIVVKNAIPQVKKAVKLIVRHREINQSLYIAKGDKKLNGNYVSGIIEGLAYFNVIND